MAISPGFASVEKAAVTMSCTLVCGPGENNTIGCCCCRHATAWSAGDVAKGCMIVAGASDCVKYAHVPVGHDAEQAPGFWQYQQCFSQGSHVAESDCVGF